MPAPSLPKLACSLLLLPLLIGCASKPRQLMPTPDMYRLPSGEPVFAPEVAADQTPEIDLLYITDRAPETKDARGTSIGTMPTCVNIAPQNKGSRMR